MMAFFKRLILFLLVQVLVMATLAWSSFTIGLNFELGKLEADRRVSNPHGSITSVMY